LEKLWLLRFGGHEIRLTANNIQKGRYYETVERI